MKKTIVFDKRAEKEFSKIPEEIQQHFSSVFDLLEATGKLDFPLGKKIQAHLFEIRLKTPDQWRSLYTYAPQERIIILSFFVKKTQRTPLREIEKAMQRRKYWEINL